MSRRPKIVAYTVVKNEAWIIEHCLGGLSELADEIIVIDDGSTDGTPDIAAQFPGVTEIVRIQNPRAWREVSNRNLGLRLAQARNPEWIIMVDADEIFEARLNDRIDALLRESNGAGEFRFTKVFLWRGIKHYRVDRPEKFLRPAPWRLVRNVSTLRWTFESGGFLRRLGGYVTGRVRLRQFQGGAVLSGVGGQICVIPELVLLHFSHLDWSRVVKKQMRYIYYFKTRYPRRHLDDLVDWCYLNLDETGLELGESKREWFSDNLWEAFYRKEDHSRPPGHQ